jgi:ParB-like chromosome segregation protein Spo0J
MKPKRPSLFQGGDVAAVDPRLQRLMQICGIQELPPVHTKFIPLERISVPGEMQVRPSSSFIRSVELIGIRQPPSVAFCAGTNWEADDASYVVVMGRRRIVSARRLLAKGDTRFKTIKCEVYEQSVPRLNAFLALVENTQRSESWIQDVVSLRQLIREGVAMTLDDLKASGFNARTIKGRLDIALLPDSILDQICAGALSQDAALQITRLTQTQSRRLETLLGSGEELTVELVSGLLKQQVNQGLAAVHTDLSEVWTTLANQSQVDSAALLSSETSVSGPPDVSRLLDVLRQFEPQTRTDTALLRAGTLIGVLIKELEIVQGSQVSQQEGEPTHV